jgi:DNA polymerase III sliding clamp (beta) subunit (PCNA family)
VVVPALAAQQVARLLASSPVTGQLYARKRVLTPEEEALVVTTVTQTTPKTIRQKHKQLVAELQRPTYIHFRAPGIELWTRLVEGEFPEYQPLLQRPKASTTVTMPKVPLITAVKACLACAPKRALGISLTRLPTGVRVRLEATENGSVERVIECRGWQPGQYIGLNAHYFLDALECTHHKEVVLQITDAATPVHLDDDELQIVIMPVRVSEPAESQRHANAGDPPDAPAPQHGS